MELSDSGQALLDMHREWLQRLELKVDEALAESRRLAAAHTNSAAHNHTPANCALAGEVSKLRTALDRARGALWAIGLLAIPGAAAGANWFVDWVKGQ